VNIMARLLISDGDSSRTVELTDASTVAGRAPENKIVIDDKQASRRHFSIDKIEYGFKIVDLESRNGTRVNDRQVNQQLLRPGDKIVIGKHTLTFEDPSFKEPPPEVAAKLAPPPSGPAPKVEVAAGNPPLPVATEAPKPPPAAPAPPVEDYRSKRNRSGHTTAVQKHQVHVQLQEEKKTLTMVAVGAGVFVFVILILIFIPSGGGSTDANPSKPGGKLAPSMAEQLSAEKEAHDFEELTGYYEKNKNTSTAFNEIIKKVDDFEKAHPRSPNGAKAREYRAAAQNGIKTSRNAAFTEAERAAQEDFRKNEFGNGMKKVRELLQKYKTDADIYERLSKLKDQAIEDGKTYFKTKLTEAESMKFSRKDEAREAFQSLLKTFGSGLVPEFDAYCQICRVSLEGLQ